MQPWKKRPTYFARETGNLELWLRSHYGDFQLSGGTTAVAIDADPVGYVADYSVNGRNAVQATAGNRPTWAKYARPGGRGALKFASAANQNLSIPYAAALDLLGDFTVEACFNLISDNNNYYQNAFLAMDVGGGLLKKWMFTYSGGGVSIAKGTHFEFVDALGVNHEIHGDTWTAEIGTWYHVAVTRSGSTWTFYKNGVAAGTATLATAIPDMSGTSQPLTVGYSESTTLNAYLDELRVYSVARNAKQIYDDYLSGIRRGFVVSDSFTDTNGTAVSAHTPEIGPLSTSESANNTISSNKAINHVDQNADDASTYYPAVYSIGVSDVTIEADVTGDFTSSLIFDLPNLVARYSDHNNYWMMQPYNGTISLFERVAGNFTRRDFSSFTFVTGTTYAFKLVLSGLTITGYINGTQVFQYAAAASNLGATKHGYVFTVRGGASTVATVDNFRISY